MTRASKKIALTAVFSEAYDLALQKAGGSFDKFNSRLVVACPITEIKPLDLAREWNRLLESGGHFCSSGLPRPLSAETVGEHRRRGPERLCSRDHVGPDLGKPRRTE
jgi:hypothetical protein